MTFALNVTLSGGMNLVPFMGTTKEAFLAPVNGFLGDHGTANITAANDNDGVVPPPPASLPMLVLGIDKLWEDWKLRYCILISEHLVL